VRLGVRSKLFTISLLLIVVVVVVSGLILQGRLQGWLEHRLEDELTVQARLGAELVMAVPEVGGIAETDSLADALAVLAQTRVTIIGSDGRVLGDSDLDLQGLRTVENHSERPEFRTALETGLGVARRYSSTLGTSMLYVAVPYRHPGGASGVVRVALPLYQVGELRRSLRGLLGVAGLVGILVAVLISLIAAHLMSGTLREVAASTRAIARGGTRRRIAAHTADEIGGIAGSVNRIADELERTVSALAGERNRFEAVLESMNEAVIALDPDLHITLVNAAAMALLGLKAPPLGLALVETIRVPAVRDLVTHALSGQQVTGEFDLGGTHPLRVLARSAPLRITGGVVLVLHDVTELRRLETIRRDFVANVSHELRTPVSIIRANTETLLDGAAKDPDRAQRFLEAILRNAERLSDLVADLLDISRLEAGEYRPQPVPVSVREAVQRALGPVRTAIEAKGQTLEVRIPDEASVLADGQALDQILFNLLDNAVKYAPDGSRIELRVAVGDNRVRIEVADDGPGIDPRHRERVFERFYRVDEGRSRERGGTGLGLSIVKHLTEAMEGKVGYEPASPHGSVFWITLPTVPEGR